MLVVMQRQQCDELQTLHGSIQRPRKTNEFGLHVEGDKMMKRTRPVA